jgi:hypothetical protein
MQAVSDPWEIIEYEVKMFEATYKTYFRARGFKKLSYAFKNAVEEAAVLHTRILCQVFLCRQGEEDDITLAHILPGWPSDARYDKIKVMKDSLDTMYGRRREQGKPHWDFNKRVVHPTTHRGRAYSYKKHLSMLGPKIREMIREIECLNGKTFDLRFHGPWPCEPCTG